MYLPSLRQLAVYDVAIVCDDSGSMTQPAASENPNVSRWAELRQSVQILLRVTEAMGKERMYFHNRGFLPRGPKLRVSLIREPPALRTLSPCWILCGRIGCQKKEVADRPFILHLFTDGHPTDQTGNENPQQFASWVSRRQFITKYIHCNLALHRR